MHTNTHAHLYYKYLSFTQVSSHKYGAETPLKGERREVMLEPVWVPSSGRGSIPAEPEPPRRRSTQYNHVSLGLCI